MKKQQRLLRAIPTAQAKSAHHRFQSYSHGPRVGRYDIGRHGTIERGLGFPVSPDPVFAQSGINPGLIRAIVQLIYQDRALAEAAKPRSTEGYTEVTAR